ncbi:MAG: iron complex outermembrane recepter protein [Thiomicrorhabdus sp.]|nr:MAG: iron complex outermembrane recepter protein [Thiomicrorhabdus sp.]
MQKSKLSLAILAALMASQVQAADSVELDSITVTATRSAEEILSQPLSVAKKGVEEKQLDQAMFQKDVLNSIASVSIKQTGSVIGHTAAIRTPNTTLPYFLYLQDGIPVQSSGFFNHNAMAYTNFQTAQTAEVIKGAGTALYGSDAIAATVNIQSKQPGKGLDRKLDIYGGSDAFKQGSLKIRDSVGDDIAYGFDASITDSDGWREHTEVRRTEFTGLYNISTENNDFKISLLSNHSRAQQAGSLLSIDALENDTRSMGDIESKLASVDAMRQFDHNRIGMQWDSFMVQDLEMSTIAYARNNRNQYTATWKPSLPHNDSTQNTVGVMHKGTLTPSWGRFIYGVDGEVTQGTTIYSQQFDDAGNNILTGEIYNYNVDYVAAAPYVHTDWNIAEKYTLSTGLRYDINRYNYTNNLADGEYGTSGYVRATSRNDSYEHLSPKLSLNYALASNTMIYARYANAFRVPSASRLYNLTDKSTQFKLDPEVSNTYELGYKVTGKSTDVEVALYYMDIADTITKYKDGATVYYDNGGTTVNQGFELSIKHMINDQWTTKLAYSRSSHRFANDATYGDSEMAAAPNNNLNLRLFYRPSGSGLLLMAEGIFVGDYYMDHAQTTSYAGYKILNLKADYQINDTWRVYAKLDNVMDERYAESATYGYGKEKYTPGAVRQAFIGMNVDW